ncbi:tRNA:m(4)X modification enzyme TRM13 homolog isoform X1 [Bombyx mandarina]|uniref:tRNA:m(4)X modification enzyme TRM13 n=1 Tax=Bombyx mandarina TaxID=7092 RepID=A0A6J2K5U4_BOMMA|nr:tRNA:m(4)X modification enzyme TRM13 homolog isoform X1 [Bombyx mandarina]
MSNNIHSTKESNGPQCQYFVLRKKRLCRMTVRPGNQYCGEHQPPPNDCLSDKRIACPNDPKHTCYISKLEKHLTICNARQQDQPPYIEYNINTPITNAVPRILLSEIPGDIIIQVINKVNSLYDKFIKSNIVSIPERVIHAAVAPEFNETDRQESSRRHLRQTSSLLWLVEEENLVDNETCYVELGAGKGQLSFYAHAAWCAGAGSSVLLVDRATLRHKRDGRLRGRGAARLRAELAHLALHRVPAAATARRLVGLAKHLCGVATDYALRCMTSEGVLGKTRGVVIATCCHHRCEYSAYVGNRHLLDMGVTAEDLNAMLGLVSWATCGDGRNRLHRQNKPASDEHLATTETDHSNSEVGCDNNLPDEAPPEQLKHSLSREQREQVGRRAKALLDWGRKLYLEEKGFNVKLCHYVPIGVSPENVCIVATKM